MQMGKTLGMRLMDESIVELLENGKISLDSAINNVNNKALLKKFMPVETEPPPEEDE